LLIPVGLGLLVKYAGWIPETDGSVLQRFVVRFTVPQLIFHSMYTAQINDFEQLVPMAVSFLLVTGIFALAGLGTSRLQVFSDRGRRHAYLLSVTFGNYGWIGWAVADTVLGESGLSRAFFFTLLWWPAFYIVGLLVCTGRDLINGVPKSVRHRIVSGLAPSLVAVVTGMSLNLADCPLPDWALSTIDGFGSMSVPLILLTTGMRLDLKRATGYLGYALRIAGVRLLLGPVIGLIVVSLMPLDAVSSRVIVLMAGMPTATMIPVFSELVPLNQNMVSAAIVVSTLLSLATIPLLALIIV